jgi:hypothetical protein
MSLAAVKRLLTVGTRVHIEYHTSPALSRDAAVTTVQTNAIDPRTGEPKFTVTLL